jgi:cardiolipin synthase
MLAAIDAAVDSVAFEVYTFQDCLLGSRFRTALTEAAARGVKVRVLVDAIGSVELPDYFWHPLQAAGGEVRVFNPLSLGHLSIRNHRKLLACDERVAFIGGFNIAHQYEGDGVVRGWCDLGVRLNGPLAAHLAASFDRMFSIADLRHKPFFRLRRSRVRRTLEGPSERLLLSGPGRGATPLRRALHRDLRRMAAALSQRALTVEAPPVGAPNAPHPAGAVPVRIVVAYFLPPWRLRRDLQRIARRGGRVQLILAGKTDVSLAQLAARSLYQRLLRSGVEVYEYQPQVLHAKLFILGGSVYVGSANLDLRSLRLNYELMVRFDAPEIVAQADAMFDALLASSRRIEKKAWKRSRSVWARWKERWANFLLARLDPWLSLREWHALPD